MVRFCLVLFLLLSFLRADILDQKIKSLVGEKNYESHQRLINKLFQNRQDFYITSNRVDILKVIKVLKNNGLLKIFFESPKKNYITFKTNSNPVFFMKIIEETLINLGYYNFLTDEIKKDNDIFEWKISFILDYTLDPEIFTKFLIKNGCEITDIIRDDENSWEYTINANSAHTNSIEILPNEEKKLSRSLKDYWLKIDGGKKISIASYGGNRWYPKIVVYDKNLKILKIYKKEEKTNWLVMDLPLGSYYIKISDIFTLDNLKYGLKVTLR